MASIKKHYHFFHTESSNEENALVLTADAKDLEFEVQYFGVSCIGSTPRYILALNKTSWKNNSAQTWFEDPDQPYGTPFGVMPVLRVRSQGLEVTLTESIVIDHYLAKKFNLLGSNEYESVSIQAFYSSIHYLRERSLQTMTWTFPDKRQEAFQKWKLQVIPKWIEIQEQHLERNGANGHFFGDKLTLADIHFVSFMDHLNEIPRGDELLALFKASSLLWMVHETVLENPAIAEWRQSEIFADLVRGGKTGYKKAAFKEE
ncbi:Glutathione S-transferase S1 [Mortierella claussenii]|nr:Glutathione S-transferase S1 [Mortierella claussenii]